jgi:hypothetical protein
MAKHLISKTEAARRQLEIAINLYFYDPDFVSVHTLAAAAFRLLRDVCGHRQLSPITIRDHLLERVQPEHRSVVLRKLTEAENFFKHADRDADATLEFNPGQTEFILWDASMTYSVLTGDTPPVLGAYTAWHIIQHPNLFRLPAEFERARGEAADLTKTMPKSEAFHLLVQSRMKMATPPGSSA